MIERLRSGDWLDAARVRGYLILFALLNGAALALLIVTSRGGIDRNGFLLGTDFLSFWSEGKLLASGGAAYDSAAHIALQRQWYASPDGYTAFFYPPSFLPFVRPLGALGYFPALIAWLTLTGAAFVAALRRWAPELPRPQLALAFVAFPATLLVIDHGQTSFLVAALLGGGAALTAQGRKVAGGALLGLATIKPQFGIVLPIVLIAARQWRAIAVACVSALGLAAVSALWFGASLWSDWLVAAQTAQAAMSDGAIGFAKLVTPYAAERELGGRSTLAFAVQAGCTIGVAAILGAGASVRGFTTDVAAATLAGALLATPFALDYDLVLLAFPLLAIATGTPRPWERSVAALAFALPAFARPLALTTHLPIAPFVIAALFALLLRRAIASNEKGAA